MRLLAVALDQHTGQLVAQRGGGDRVGPQRRKTHLRAPRQRVALAAHEGALGLADLRDLQVRRRAHRADINDQGIHAPLAQHLRQGRGVGAHDVDMEVRKALGKVQHDRRGQHRARA